MMLQMIGDMGNKAVCEKLVAKPELLCQALDGFACTRQGDIGSWRIDVLPFVLHHIGVVLVAWEIVKTRIYAHFGVPLASQVPTTVQVVLAAASFTDGHRGRSNQAGEDESEFVKQLHIQVKTLETENMYLKRKFNAQLQTAGRSQLKTERACLKLEKARGARSTRIHHSMICRYVLQ